MSLLKFQALLDVRRLSGQTAAMLIYKIFRAAEWADMQYNGETAGAPVDLSDGFIHFSTAETVAKTAELHFAGEDGLFLIAVAADDLDQLKWEPSRGGTLFPHLFRKLTMDDVLWAKSLPLADGVHQFPDL